MNITYDQSGFCLNLFTCNLLFFPLITVLMSEAGVSATRREVDPGRKYGIMLNNNSNSWKCIYCKKYFNTGISCLKQHLRGDHRNAKACNLYPLHVREELIRNKQMKEDEIAARNLALQEE